MRRYDRAMLTLLEAAPWQPVNFAIGIVTFLVLVLLMAALHGFGASRPHS